MYGFMIWGFFFFGLVSPLKTPVGGMSRPNFGVDFNFAFAFNNMHGSWKHVWSVDLMLLNRKMDVSLQMDCEAIDPMCGPANHFLNAVVPAWMNASELLQDQFSWVKNPSILATLNRMDETNRKRRAILPFVGDIEKFFFGTATESDITSLKSTLDDLEQLHGKTVSAVSQIGDNLASLTKLTSDEIANTKQGFEKIKSTFQNLTSQVNSRFTSIMNQLSKEGDIVKYNSLAVAHTWAMLEQIMLRMLDVTRILVSDIQLVDGIQTILQGFIPMAILSPKELKSGLETAEAGIIAQFPSAKLTHPVTSLGFYYTHKIVTPYFSEDKLSLIVDIPVDLGQELIYAYAIRTFPVNILPYNPYSHTVDPNSKIATASSILSLKEDFFLVSESGETWSSASHLEMSTCVGESIRVCRHQLAMYKFLDTQCIERIWNNAPFAKILDVCPYQLSHPGSSFTQNIHVQVIPLSSGRWYIESPLGEQWTITCPSRAPEKRSSCTSCVIQVDCGCGVSSRYFSIPTRVSSCETVFSPLRRNFTLNPFNYSPSGQPWVVNLTGDDQIVSPPKMNPDIRLPDGGSWDDVLENMDAKQFDLNKLYESQQNDTRVFRTEAEALLKKIRDQDKLLASLSGWPDWILGLVVFLTFVNSGVLALLLFCIISRVRARSIGDELNIIETTQDVVLGFELVQFIFIVASFILLVCLAWPILSGWIKNNKLYLRYRGYSVRVKAEGVRSVKGYAKVKLIGQFFFQTSNHTAERSIPCLATLAMVPPGTHIGMDLPSLAGAVIPQGKNYIFTLSPGVLMITPNDESKMCKRLEFGFDYIHRKFNVPMSCRWVRAEGCQVWIE